MLALDKVRFVGEAVALVLADDPHVAEQAVQLITADYEELPAVYDEVEALTSSVIVHDELKPAGTFADLKHLSGRKNTNVTLDYQLRRGDVDAAFASAGRVFEHTFRTQPVTHTTLEPFICLAELNEDTLTLHTTTQMPSFVRIEIARLLGWTENRVRVKVLHLGGGFAAKTYIRIEALAAVAALLTRRPVRLLLTMEEQFYTVVAHASTFKIKSAVDRDGRITARQCHVSGTAGPTPTSVRGWRRSPASRRRGPTRSTTSRSTPPRSIPTGRSPRRAAASAFRSCAGPTRATPT